MDMENYYSPEKGWQIGELFACGERIKDVQLRGQQDEEKLFVTIERRFGRGHPSSWNRTYPARHIMKSAQEGADWGPASLVEERTLVFMRERTEEELKALAMGEMLPVKYLKCMVSGNASTFSS